MPEQAGRTTTSSRPAASRELRRLLRALEDSGSRDDHDRLMLAATLAARRDIDALVAIAEAGEFPMRHVLWLLREGTSERIKAIFLNHLSDPNPEVRWTAAEGLALYAGRDVEGAMIKCLRDRDRLVKMTAMLKLRQIGTERALQPLRRILGLKSIQQHSPGMIRTAKQAIERIEKRAARRKRSVVRPRRS